MEKTKKNNKIIFIIIAVVILAIVAIGLCVFIMNKQSGTGVEWGDVYYSALKRDSDELNTKDENGNEISMPSIYKNTKNAEISFIETKGFDEPLMAVSCERDNGKQTVNVYAVYEVNSKKHAHAFMQNPGINENYEVIETGNNYELQLLYNIAAKEYRWYVHETNDTGHQYMDVEIYTSTSSESIIGNNITPTDEIQTSYSFTNDEMKTNQTDENGVPIISKFEETFIVPEVGVEKIKVGDLYQIDDKTLKNEVKNAVTEFKDIDSVVTEEVKTETENTTKQLENKKEQIKLAEEEKARKEAEEKAAAEEAARKAAEEKEKAEEEARKKAEEEAANSKTVQTGEYSLQGNGREGGIIIKSASENSVSFEIGVVNLYGGNHMGELSGTATKSGNKYVYTNSEYGQTYKLYIEANGNTIEVTTSKMLNGDGFDPFCGVNAYFDGTYKK